MVEKRKSSKRWKQRGWKTYKDAYRAFSDLRHQIIEKEQLQPGQPFPAWFNEFGLWLVQGHPDAVDIFEHGLAYFTFHENGHDARARRSHGYVFVDTRGTRFVFSVATALRGFGLRDNVRLYIALRNEVHAQTRLVRDAAVLAGALCPETGVVLTDVNTEVDHIGVNFVELAKSFFREARLDPDQIEITDDRRIKDGEIIFNWVCFHKNNARLEAVSRAGHVLRTQRRAQDPLQGLRS